MPSQLKVMGCSLLFQRHFVCQAHEKAGFSQKSPAWSRISPYIGSQPWGFVIAAPLRFKNWPPKVRGSLALSLCWQEINRLAGELSAHPASLKLLCERCICEGFLTAKPLKPTQSSPAEICHRLTVFDVDFHSLCICQNHLIFLPSSRHPSFIHFPFLCPSQFLYYSYSTLPSCPI